MIVVENLVSCTRTGIEQLKLLARKACFALLLLIACGGHVAVLQVTAWSSMLIQRAPEMGWDQAVTSTFDGTAPCAICQAVQEIAPHSNKASQKERDKTEWPFSSVKPLVGSQQPQLASDSSHYSMNWQSRRRLRSLVIMVEPPPPRVTHDLLLVV